MLRTAPYFTTAPITGLLPQLFDSPLRSAIDRGNRIGAALEYLLSSEDSVAPSPVAGSQLISLVHAIAESPPVFTVYQLGIGGRANASVFISPFAPLLNIVV